MGLESGFRANSEYRVKDEGPRDKQLCRWGLSKAIELFLGGGIQRVVASLRCPPDPATEDYLGADLFRGLGLAQVAVVGLDGEEGREVLTQGASFEDFSCIFKTIALET